MGEVSGVVVLDGGQLGGGVAGQGGEHHPLLVVGAAEDLVVVKEELVPDTEPVAALLTREALEVVNISPGPHHHLEGGDDLLAGGAVAGGAKQSEVVPLAEEEVPLGVQRLPHLTQPGVTAPALEAFLVPVEVKGLMIRYIQGHSLEKVRSRVFFPIRSERLPCKSIIGLIFCRNQNHFTRKTVNTRKMLIVV